MNRLPPLITRMRRRFMATAWLGVFAILFKIGVATVCMNDAVRADTGAAPVSSMALDVSASSIASDDGLATTCWHASAGGCHCGCLHGSALPIAVTAVPSLALFDAAPSFASPSPQLTPREPALRPPIA